MLLSPYFWGSNDHIEYEEWKSNFEAFFGYFILTSEQKYFYAQMRLVGHAYWWRKDNHNDDQCWFVLQDLRSLYASHLLYASEAGYNDPNVEQEPESRSITDICSSFGWP